MRPNVNDFRGNSRLYLPPTVLSVPPRREEEKAIFERACSSLEVNKFIRDKLQPDEIFHRLFNDAIDSLYRELQRDLQYTNYGIYNLIKVSGETATTLPPFPQTHTHTQPKRCWGVVKKDAGAIESKMSFISNNALRRHWILPPPQAFRFFVFFFLLK